MSPPFEAIIFDMDGVLVDSEPIWRRVEVEVFRAHGVPLTEAECAETMGLRLDEVVRHRMGGRPHDAAAIERAIMDRMVEVVSREGEPKAGALEAVTFAKRKARIALASSSPLRLIRATLDRLGLGDVFEVVHSAEHESHGKPHPAVYLTTAERLAIHPSGCVAIEDSLRGVLAAKAASMRCIAVPEAPDPRFAIADVVLSSLSALDDAIWSSLVEAARARPGAS